ncbi:FHA domain-containing protein [Rhodococcus gannanensis]|uniref:FHA domain-containing protein n=1 Tax=Rhodococcus gannanensis TaxID=1960308 RepID=A0ABW4P8E6_9NOCA
MTAEALAYVRLAAPDGRGAERWDLDPDRPRLTVGRSGESDVSLPDDEEVSRIHAVIEFVGGHWTLLDDGLSRNGTYLNGDRITGRRRLRPGDSVRVGGTVLIFQEFGAAEDDATMVAGTVPDVRSVTQTQRSVLIALCRPFKHGSSFANPASNQQIADELFLTVDTVKTHLRTLFGKFGVEDLPQNRKRVALAERALQLGVVTGHDL